MPHGITGLKGPLFYTIIVINVQCADNKNGINVERINRGHQKKKTRRLNRMHVKRYTINTKGDYVKNGGGRGRFEYFLIPCNIAVLTARETFGGAFDFGGCDPVWHVY